MIKIVFPEIGNPVIDEAMERVKDIEVVPAINLTEACQVLAEHEVDAMIGGIDYTSREVILACRDIIGMTGKTFSGAFVMTRGEERYILADAAACKEPTEEQMFEIICQTYETAKALLGNDPRVAVLSFSTLGSGGHSDALDRSLLALERVRRERPEIMIDGEMQLDAAVNPIIGKKKAPGSLVAGKANVLIMPDLNSGNILYKAMEQFGGFTAAGPILQGFKMPVSDLSRGSTVEDVVAVIEVMKKLAEKHWDDIMKQRKAEGKPLIWRERNGKEI